MKKNEYDWKVIKREHVIEVINRIKDGKEEPQNYKRKTYIIYQEGRYPARFVLGRAYELVTGKKADLNGCGGKEGVVFYLFGGLGFRMEYDGNIYYPDEKVYDLKVKQETEKQKNIKKKAYMEIIKIDEKLEDIGIDNLLDYEKDIEAITFEQIINDKSVLDVYKSVEGVYKVYLPEDIDFEICKTSAKYALKEYEAEELTETWEVIQKANQLDDRLIYIGRSKNLQARLNAFAKFGMGYNAKHDGGKAIWQLANAMKCEIYCFPKDIYFPNIKLEDQENGMILDFENRHDKKKPLANKRREKRKNG